MIVFNNPAVAFNPAAGPGVVRRTLLTDENVEKAGIRFDCLTLAADASFRFEPSARSMVWFQVLEGDAKLKTEYSDGLTAIQSLCPRPSMPRYRPNVGRAFGDGSSIRRMRGACLCCAPNYRMPDGLTRSSRPSSRFSRCRIGRGNRFCSARTMDASGFPS